MNRDIVEICNRMILQVNVINTALEGMEDEINFIKDRALKQSEARNCICTDTVTCAYHAKQTGTPHS